MNKFENIVILAAGMSRRFWPLSDKNLFIFSEQSLLSWQFKKIKQLGNKIHVVTNEQNFQQIKKIVESFHKNSFVYPQKGQGQSAAILTLKDKLKGTTLILNANDLYEDDLIQELISEIGRVKPDVLLSAVLVDQYVPGGYLRIKSGKVDEVVEKPGQKERPSNFFKLVVDYFKDIEEFIEFMTPLKGEGDDLYERALSKYMKTGKITHFFEYKKAWATLKYPWHVLSASKLILANIKSHRGKNVTVDRRAKIIGDVYLDDGVKVLEYSKIVGPTFIGKNSVVGNYSLVVESMIGRQCMIGGYTEVTRSYLGKNVWLHRNYIGDSVLEDNILIGAGTILANFRFDERNIRSYVDGTPISSGLNKFGAIIGSNVKIGVGSTLMPGVKVGPKSQVLPHQMIKEDVR